MYFSACGQDWDQPAAPSASDGRRHVPPCISARTPPHWPNVHFIVSKLNPKLETLNPTQKLCAKFPQRSSDAAGGGSGSDTDEEPGFRV